MYNDIKYCWTWFKAENSYFFFLQCVRANVIFGWTIKVWSDVSFFNHSGIQSPLEKDASVLPHGHCAKRFSEKGCCLTLPLFGEKIFEYFFMTDCYLSFFFFILTVSHYKLFPKSFGQIINQYSVEELHLTLTQGQWPHELWGYPVVSAPPGTELWVFFKDNIQKR